MAWINDGCLLCNSCGVTNMQSRKQKSTLWTMQVGIFDGLVDDILYHLWIITQSWFSQKRLRIHSIERLALNVAKRSLATICSRASLTLGLPYRVAIESVPEPKTQKAAHSKQWRLEYSMYQQMIFSTTCESLLFSVEFSVKTICVPIRSDGQSAAELR